MNPRGVRLPVPLPDARILCPMTPASLKLPRIGIPWRTSEEEIEQNRPKIRNYESAVREAGGEAVLLSVREGARLREKLSSLEGFVLPGSPADVEPKEYGSRNTGKSEPADPLREQTDRAILSHAFAEKKPVLAICYGCQFLNVYLGGTLIQDVRSETGTSLAHRKTDVGPEAVEDPRHTVRFEAASRLATMAGGTNAEVNSSHHQSVDRPGRELRVTGKANDGIVESLEWVGDTNWVIGVQWHPERMPGDALAQRLFSELVAAAKSAARVDATKT
jgi:putative glutamine amidotransferase